jgi:hypothetical protein
MHQPNSGACMGASSPQSTVQPFLPGTIATALTMLRATDVQYNKLCPSSDCRPRCSLALTREPLAGFRESAVNRDHCQWQGHLCQNNKNTRATESQSEDRRLAPVPIAGFGKSSWAIVDRWNSIDGTKETERNGTSRWCRHDPRFLCCVYRGEEESI